MTPKYEVAGVVFTEPKWMSVMAKTIFIKVHFSAIFAVLKVTAVEEVLEPKLQNFFGRNSDQSFKGSTIVNYDSRVVPD